MNLTRAVLDALLREDLLGIRSRGQLVDGRLTLVVAGHTVSIPVRQDGFQCDIAVAEPLVECDGRVLTELDAILAVFRQAVPPVDVGGFDAFVAECQDAATAARLHREHRPDVLARIGGSSLRYDTLAAYAGHPIYPTGLARWGLAPADQVRYAPEYHPTFPLRWTSVPADAVTFAGALPLWWPTAGELGLTGVPFPVHPVATAEGPELVNVTPTLSMRTVQVRADPRVHIKLPLPTSTLGLRNRRTIKPGTLSDAAIVGRQLAAILADEPEFDRVLVADEQTYAHTDDEMLAFLVRRYPALDGDVVPVAALGARTERDQTVLDELADRYYHGDRTALLTDYLRLLFDFHVTLLLRHGIALEAHQQNVSLVLSDTEIRLLYKDNDGPRIRDDRLTVADPASIADQRILVEHTQPLIDVFVTITLHLSAAAIVFAANGMRAGRGLIRELLTAAIDRHPDSPDRRLLIARTLQADRLPVKAMVTAGTVLSKDRSGADDINKCYRMTGPNYLAR